MSFLPDGVVRHLREITDLPDLTGTRYRLIGRLGSGGMGTVHLVEDVELGREAALKVLAVPDPAGDLSRRLIAEARLIAALEHPNIVPVHDVGALPDGRVFYVMKLVRGRRLDEWLVDPAPTPALLRLFQKICEAVAFAHARGIVHRDLKPENIMIGSFGEALVMDWGVAKVLRDGRPAHGSGVPPGPEPSISGIATLQAAPPGSRETRDGAVIGTPTYMAPEQARGETERIDARTDVYALGSILFHLLCRRPPYDGATAAEILGRVREGNPPSPRAVAPGVAKGLDAICRKAMSREPEGRYATAEEMAEDVSRFLDGRPVGAHRETLVDRSLRFLDNNRALALLVLAYLLMRVGALILLRR